MAPLLDIDPDPARARTPPASFYRDPAIYAAVQERVLARTWHVLGKSDSLAPASTASPATLLPGSLSEPLLVIADEAGPPRAVSNACTHRGNLVATAPCPSRALRCGYHGRRFGPDGRCLGMPELDGAPGFPGPGDHLAPAALGAFGPLLLASLRPAMALDELTAPLRERLAGLPWARLSHDPTGDRAWEFDACWALYCDNYLEGLHIPFVHPALARAVDYRSYRTLTFRWGSLQLGLAPPGQPAFELPPGHPDAGSRVAGFYFWLFPTTMLNFYPWGLSLNMVQPLGPTRTRVLYQSWVWDESARGQGAGSGLDQVEREDQRVVATTQAGLAGRLYDRGRYVPGREAGVHHFHRLLAEFLG